MKKIILQKSNFRCRENIYICRPLRRLRRLAVEYVKKIFKFSLVPRASTSKFLLVLLPNNLSLSRKNKLALNFLLARRTLGEKICLSCLKFNLSQASVQVIFLPLFINCNFKCPKEIIFVTESYH